MASILSARGVTKRFGGLVAVDHVNVEIEEKSIHAVIGPNGAGKTTFFNCITGFYPINEGKVIFRGSRWSIFHPIKLHGEAFPVLTKIFACLPT